MDNDLSRRQWLLATGATLSAGAVGALAPSPAIAAEKRSPAEPFGYCLNTSTIRAEGLDLIAKVELAAKAGYHAIEPWINEIEQHVKQGGSLKDLAERIRDHGLIVASAIGFARWLVDGDAERAKGLEQAKRDMDLVRQIGGQRIAAPPAGATGQSDLDLFKAAERYRALLELGTKMGVVPQLEVWGFSKSLSRLGETLFVAAESGHPAACLLPDVYHIYKGGSDFVGLKLLGPAAMHVFHVNDYPADPPRDKIGDAHRVYTGDGVAPLGEIFRTLAATGFRGMLSLELFNRDYWKQDPLTVARTGLEKTKAAVRRAFS